MADVNLGCAVGWQVHTWDRFDVFRVAELTQGRPLYTVTLAIMDALGLLVRTHNSKLRFEHTDTMFTLQNYYVAWYGY